MKTLLIVESPAKARTLQKYLGKDTEVLASKGHIKDLPKKDKDAVDVEHDFQERYEIIDERGKAEIVRKIKDRAKHVDQVLLATDPDREGEAIAYHLAQEVVATKTPATVRRVLFHELTKKGVAEGMSHPRDLNDSLYEAQRTRRVLDRLGGYQVSGLLWRKLNFGLSAGRVQTPALRLIVDRESEIDAFVSRAYWLVDVTLVGSKRPAFTAHLESVGSEKLERVSSRPAAVSALDAERFADDLRRASFRVSRITKKEQRKFAPAPYTTSKLQQDAANRLGLPPRRAMQVAQSLYEGVDVGKGEPLGLITYMRTDSVRLSEDAVQACRDYIAETFGADEVPAKPNAYRAKKTMNVQDAHEAIRPTDMTLTPDRVRKYLKDDQHKLYKLIWDRFVACQMLPAIYDQTSVDIDASADGCSYGLRASGSVLRRAGWRAVYGASAAPLAGEEEEPEGGAKGEPEEAADGVLPELAEGEPLTPVDPPGVTVTAKQTEPAPRFTEASLVKKLEEEGIGRPSTYAEILSKVQARDYVAKVGGKLLPTPLGRLVIERLVANGFDLADIGFTRKLEEDLDEVAEARLGRVEVLRPFYTRLVDEIERAKTGRGKWWPDPEPIGEKCPNDAAELVRRWGKNGPFVACPNYPDCTYTRSLPKLGDAEPDSAEAAARKPELTDYDCPLCSKKMLKRWGKNGWFLGCPSYPTCKGTRSLPLGVACPKCGGEVVEIRPKGRGRTFYGCSNYASEKKCDFKIWTRPVPMLCDRCGAKFLVRAGSKQKPMLRCATVGCGFETPDPAMATGADGQDAASSDGASDDERERPVRRAASAPHERRPSGEDAL